MFTQAYSPEQSAHGQLENGQHLLILYVKEYAQELTKVNEDAVHKFEYTWFANEDQTEHVLHIRWENDVHVSVRFTPAQEALLDYLKAPRNLIISAIPIPELVEQSPSGDLLNLTGPVATFSGMVFSKPITTETTFENN